MSQKPALKIDWASHEAAKFACVNWHYSGLMPSFGKFVKVGAWENEKFIGVVVFGRGANPQLLKPYGLQQDEGCELVRIALNKHKTPVSKIITIALKFLKKANPKLRLVVSYADVDQNHHGGIYQASNWIYTGHKNKGSRSAFIINGEKIHTKTVASKGVRQTIDEVRKHLDPNAEIFYTLGKHCYIMPLDKEMRAEVIHLSKPYPKRTKEQALENPSSLGGATPTCTLQSNG